MPSSGHRSSGRNPHPDAVRVTALMGICIVNVPFMALPVEASLVPPSAALDQVAAFLVEGLFQAKFFLLFSFLFGWSLHQQAQSAQKKGVSFNRRYARRLSGLAVLGVLHAVLVFNGDILLLYALLGLVIWPLRQRDPATLIRIALTMVPLGVVSLTSLGILLPDTLSSGTTLGGGYWEATRTRWLDWPGTFAFLLLFQGPLAFAAFASGLAAAKSGFFETPLNRGRVSLNKGLPWLISFGVTFNLYYAAAMSWVIPPERGLHSLAGLVVLVLGAPLLSAAYLGLLLKLTERYTLPDWLMRAGRNSLSVYVLQGILAGAVFGGYGLGLFGTMGQGALFFVAIAVAVMSMAIVSVLAKRFERGPLEALLRAWTYGGTP